MFGKITSGIKKLDCLTLFSPESRYTAARESTDLLGRRKFHLFISFHRFIFIFLSAYVIKCNGLVKKKKKRKRIIR